MKVVRSVSTNLLAGEIELLRETNQKLAEENKKYIKTRALLLKIMDENVKLYKELESVKGELEGIRKFGSESKRKTVTFAE